MVDIPALFDLSGKTALITGGAGHLGKQITMALYEAGAFVIVASRDVVKCEQFCLSLDKQKKRAVALEMDIGSMDSVEKCQKEISALNRNVDILINNASSAQGMKTEEMTVDAWQSAFDGNVSGYFFCSQVFARNMIEKKTGTIINISSILGYRALNEKIFEHTPEFPPLNYAAAKGAVITLTQVMGAEMAKHNVRVNCITPGAFTPDDRLENRHYKESLEERIPLGRIGQPSDIAGAILFLSSEASSYVIGHNLVVDGGWSCW